MRASPPDHPLALFHGEGAPAPEQRQGEDLAALRARATAAARVEAGSTRGASSRPQPPDPGRILAELPRGSEGDRLRVCLRRAPEQHGAPGALFVDVRVWNRDGWPVKGKGVAVRMSELARVASALLDACDAARNDGAEGTPRRPAPQSDPREGGGRGGR